MSACNRRINSNEQALTQRIRLAVVGEALERHQRVVLVHRRRRRGEEHGCYRQHPGPCARVRATHHGHHHQQRDQRCAARARKSETLELEARNRGGYYNLTLGFLMTVC